MAVGVVSVVAGAGFSAESVAVAGVAGAGAAVLSVWAIGVWAAFSALAWAWAIDSWHDTVVRSANYIGGGFADLTTVSIVLNLAGKWTEGASQRGGDGAVDRRGSRLC